MSEWFNMSTNQGQAPADPQQPYPQQPYPQQPYGQPPAPGYGYMPPAEPPKKNGVAIWAFVLAFFLPVIPVILSIVALVRAGRRGRMGLSIAALVISLVVNAGYGLIGYELSKTNIVTASDPGCPAAISAINDNNAKASSSDPATAKVGIQATVDGLSAALSKSHNTNVQQAITALENDYNQDLNAVNTNTSAPALLQDQLNLDTDTLNTLCELGGSGN
jgi:hypothetical protein